MGSLASVKRSTVFNKFSLGGWLDARRREKKQGRLSEGRIAALDELGMRWLGPM
jgi:hypothetical protein